MEYYIYLINPHFAVFVLRMTQLLSHKTIFSKFTLELAWRKTTTVVIGKPENELMYCGTENEELCLEEVRHLLSLNFSNGFYCSK